MAPPRDPRPTAAGKRDQLYQRFYALIDSIPRGRVASYGQIAREAGLPRHARHVGYALRALPKGSKLPWYRVLNARGEVAERPGTSYTDQKRRLRAEGIRLDRRGRVDLKEYGWVPDLD